jgi:hypothetical protein
MSEARAFALCVSLFAASAALADSDSYFCSATGYLAYELREWSAPEKRHVLKIVSVGGPDGISEPGTVPLEDFQLHGMKCEPERIVLLGWDKKYTLMLPALRIVSVESRQAGGAPKDYLVERLSGMRRTRSIDIASLNAERRYQLRIAYRENRIGSGLIRHETSSMLIERDAAGKVLRRRLIHEAVAQETIH